MSTTDDSTLYTIELNKSCSGTEGDPIPQIPFPLEFHDYRTNRGGFYDSVADKFILDWSFSHVPNYLMIKLKRLAEEYNLECSIYNENEDDFIENSDEDDDESEHDHDVEEKPAENESAQPPPFTTYQKSRLLTLFNHIWGQAINQSDEQDAR